jgi:predicted phage gp36 major capsid-like protein
VAKKKRGRVIDPTENVMALVAGQVKRSDDLTAANEKLAEAKEKRQDDLRAVEAEHVREMARLRAQFDEALREKRAEPTWLSGSAPSRSGRPIGRSVSWNLFALTNAL